MSNLAANNFEEPVSAGTPLPWLGLVRSQVESLKFGVIQITVHDSRVVQIEKSEKLRLDKPERNTDKHS